MKPAGWRIAFYFTLVFVAGLVVGALADRYSLRPPPGPELPPHKSAESFRKAMVEDLTKRLNLDAQQVTQLQQILDDSRKEFQEFRERHKDEMKAMHERQHARITALLRPDQRLLYDKIEAQRRAHMERDESNK
jgi:uncharacterized protein YeaO (DUF488 family)